ncbi:MAG: hypothetical protein R2689_07510 [Microthrixaceae bacterium]
MDVRRQVGEAEPGRVIAGKDEVDAGNLAGQRDDVASGLDVRQVPRADEQCDRSVPLEAEVRIEELSASDAGGSDDEFDVAGIDPVGDDLGGRIDPVAGRQRAQVDLGGRRHQHRAFTRSTFEVVDPTFQPTATDGVAGKDRGLQLNLVVVGVVHGRDPRRERVDRVDEVGLHGDGGTGLVERSGCHLGEPGDSRPHQAACDVGDRHVAGDEAQLGFAPGCAVVDEDAVFGDPIAERVVAGQVGVGRQADDGDLGVVAASQPIGQVPTPELPAAAAGMDGVGAERCDTAWRSHRRGRRRGSRRSRNRGDDIGHVLRNRTVERNRPRLGHAASRRPQSVGDGALTAAQRVERRPIHVGSPRCGAARSLR